ncbi:MAG: quinone oxidoreductase [Pseudomonadota bacterium]
MSDYAMTVPAPGGPEAFEKRGIAAPSPGPGEALIRHTAIGLNYLDTYHRSGLYPWPVEKDLVPGSDGAGVVEAVGEGVTLVKPGDRVAYTFPLNAYSTRRCVPAERLVPIPQGVSDADAASLMIKGLTAHYLIHSTYPVKSGDHVLVQAGAGGVGLLLGQWLATKAGVTAIATAGGAEKCALAKAAGYDHVIDYASEDFVARVAEITGGALCEAVYDSVGKTTWEGSVACLKPRGVFVTFGQASGPIEGFSLATLTGGGGSLFATRPTLFHYIATREELEWRARDMFELVAAGKLKANVRQEFALSDVAEAHRALQGRKTVGATVLIP